MVSIAFKMLRINQWLKNLMLFFPPFLGGTFFSGTLSNKVVYPFVAFCAASSATYIFNDILDRENDRHHPKKSSRPIASGQIPVVTALAIAVLLLACSVMVAQTVSSHFLLLMSVYVTVSLAYSVWLKTIVLVDIFSISMGFLLRLLAGGEAFQVTVSEWLFLSVFLLSVFLSTGKRLAEKQHLGNEAYKHRKSLLAYPAGFLEGAMSLTGSAVLVTYTMYAIARHSLLLVYTVPLCSFGLLRYILRVRTGRGGDPTDSLIRDIPLLLTGLVWVAMVGWGIYG